MLGLRSRGRNQRAYRGDSEARRKAKSAPNEQEKCLDYSRAAFAGKIACRSRSMMCCRAPSPLRTSANSACSPQPPSACRNASGRRWPRRSPASKQQAGRYASAAGSCARPEGCPIAESTPAQNQMPETAPNPLGSRIRRDNLTRDLRQPGAAWFHSQARLILRGDP